MCNALSGGLIGNTKVRTSLAKKGLLGPAGEMIEDKNHEFKNANQPKPNDKLKIKY
jgi:hypothetical protein|tara:strand:+ start:189 stop:356 length:168 start_codon:yes stop_codon:yes gene_type:complete